MPHVHSGDTFASDSVWRTRLPSPRSVVDYTDFLVRSYHGQLIECPLIRPANTNMKASTPILLEGIGSS